MKENNVYKIVTERIIEQLKLGIVPWKQTWKSSGMAVSHTTGKPYSLLNQMLLGESGEYVTFSQCTKLGGTVKKGAVGRIAVYCAEATKIITKVDVITGEEVEAKIKYPILKYYHLFNINDCENISPKYTKVEQTEVVEDIECESLINDYSLRSGVKVNVVEGNSSFYSLGTDEVTVPQKQQFDTIEDFYSTVFHELTHSTGTKQRLDRDMSGVFGSNSYSREELVAEIGSAMLCARTGIETKKTFESSADYINAWLGALEGDNYMIIYAASKAEKAAKYITNE